MKKLIICEKSSLAKGVISGINTMSYGDKMKTIEYYKGKDALSSLYYYENNDYIVTAVVGHLFELKSIAEYKGVDKLSWNDIELPFKPDNFDFEISLKKGFSKRLEMIRKLSRREDVDALYNCGDNDREGEILIREILHAIDNNKTVYRLALSEVTDATVVEGLNKMISDSDYDDIANEGFARQYADWLYGINLTTYASIKMGDGMYNVGRVISAIVRAIYERDMEIKNFVSKKYLVGYSNEETNGEKIELIDKEKFEADSSNILTDEIKNDCQNYLDQLNRSTFKVTNKEEKERKVKRPKLFSQGKLQNVMNTKYGYSPKETLECVQQLYLSGYVTYPRTSSEYMATAEIPKAQEIINALNKEWNCCLELRNEKSIFDDSKVESHSAITPTNKLPDYETFDIKLKNTYIEILNRFKAVFYRDDYIIQETILLISNGKKEFKLSGNVTVNAGWSIFTSEKKEKQLPDLNVDDVVNVDFKPVQKETTPPKHYTVTSLNNFMINPFRKENSENDDEEYKNIHAGIEIGTEATRPDIIERARKHNLIKLSKTTYTITEDGIHYIEALEKLKIDISTEKSVYLNQLIKNVYRRGMTIKQCCETVFEEIDNIIKEDVDIEGMKQEKIVIIKAKCPLCGGNLIEKKGKYGIYYACEKCDYKQSQKTQMPSSDEICPECGSRMIWKKSKYGKMLACSNYPACRYIKPSEKKKVEYSDEVCPECGSKLAVRHGKYGKFIACSNYPECRYVKSKEKKKVDDTGEVCPNCGSKMVWRNGRYGKFEACSNYPSCKYIKK